jgi:hypothetical protein
MHFQFQPPEDMTPMTTRSPLRTAAAFTAAAMAITLAGVASASERRFTYTYESSVLNVGDRELEPWVTWRHGRERYYERADLRLEFEIGIARRLQTALYLNFKAVTQEEAGELHGEFEFAGVSSEWKYQLLDPVADPLGLALYLEATGAPDELEFEFKTIVDKRLGDVLLALNAIVEYELAFGVDQTEKEIEAAVTVGAAYFVTDAFTAGVELREVNVFPDSGAEWENAVLYGGPALSYATRSWWATLTVLPQLVAFKGASHGAFDLAHNEKMQARLIFGWHL